MNRHNVIGLLLSILALHAVDSTVADAEQSVSASRTLSVQQATIKNVVPPAASTSTVGDALEVVAWVDRPDLTYARGEHVRMFVETNKDAYVTILNVDPAGETTVLFPNHYQPDNLVRASRPVEVPHPSSQSRVVVTGTVGAELLKVIASTEPVPLFDTGQLSEAGPFQMVREEPHGTARSLVVAMAGPSMDGSTTASTQGGGPPRMDRVGAEWAMCHQTIATVPELTLAAQRTRSLQVLRTRDDGASVRCEEGDR